MKIISLVILAIAFAGCSSASPTIQTGEDAEVSFDGLHKVDNARFRSSWADPDIDFSRYSKIIPGGADFEFRAGWGFRLCSCTSAGSAQAASMAPAQSCWLCVAPSSFPPCFYLCTEPD